MTDLLGQHLPEVPTAPLAAWYPDPKNASQIRYWDGFAWTEHVGPAPKPAEPQMPPPAPETATSPAHLASSTVPQGRSPYYAKPAAAISTYDVSPHLMGAENAQVRRLSRYAKWTGIGWIVLGAIQIVTLVGVVAGVWNVLAGLSRIGSAKQIQARDPGIPAAYQSVSGLIIIGLVNVFLGGVIGIVMVLFDFLVRDKILKNAHLFNATISGASPSSASATHLLSPSAPTH